MVDEGGVERPKTIRIKGKEYGEGDPIDVLVNSSSIDIMRGNATQTVVTGTIRSIDFPSRSIVVDSPGGERFVLVDLIVDDTHL